MIRQAEYVLGKKAAEACEDSYRKAKKIFSPAKDDEGQEFRFNHKGQDVPLTLPGQLVTEHGIKHKLMLESPGGKYFPVCDEVDGEPLLLVDVISAIEILLEEKYAKGRRPLSTWLPFDYRMVPARFRHVIHSIIVERRRNTAPDAMKGRWPIWPAMEIVFNIVNQIATPEPVSPPFDLGEVWVTHDVDDEQGLPNAYALAELEKELGITATYFIPAKLFERQSDIIGWIKSMGHKIGLHGLRHDNRHLMIEPGKYFDELMKYRSTLDEYEVKAYRAPSLLTSSELRNALADYFEIDSSVPDTDVYSEAADERGCGYWRPYPSQGLWEVPATLPFDDRLLILYEDDTRRILDIWKRKADWIRSKKGQVVLSTHTQPGMYRGLDFLGFLKEALIALHSYIN